MATGNTFKPMHPTPLCPARALRPGELDFKGGACSERRAQTRDGSKPPTLAKALATLSCAPGCTAARTVRAARSCCSQAGAKGSVEGVSQVCARVSETSHPILLPYCPPNLSNIAGKPQKPGSCYQLGRYNVSAGTSKRARGGKGL